MIQFGIDRVVSGEAGIIDRSGRIGLVTNDAARLARDAKVTSRVALRQAGFNLVRLFGPEHGIAATAADGAAVGDSIDPLTGLAVVSLYGKSHRPSAEHLQDLDLVLFDIPDVGARFYTYIWTLSHVLEACAEATKPLFVLDRPNPIGGELNAAEGPMLDETRFSTFVGRWNMPIRFSLTIGELATVWNNERRLGASLQVVKLKNWQRQMHWPDTGLEFVPMSPAMPDYETAAVYPGTCLIEGTNLSEGRGTDAPFRTIGAPWLDGADLSDRFNDMKLPGVRADAIEFTPGGRKYAAERCRGVRLNVTERFAYRPVAAGLLLIALVRQMHPDRLAFSPYPTAVNESGGGHFDRLVGTRDVRESLQSNPRDAMDRMVAWTGVGDWHQRVSPHLIY